MKITWKELVPQDDWADRSFKPGTLLLRSDGNVSIVGDLTGNAWTSDSASWIASDFGCGCCSGQVAVTHYSDDLVSVIEEAGRAVANGEG